MLVFGCAHTYLQVTTVHIGSRTHGKEAGDCSHVNDDVDWNSALVASVQQVSENIDVGEHIHHHGDHLRTQTEETVNAVSASSSAKAHLMEVAPISDAGCIKAIMKLGGRLILKPYKVHP